MSQNAVLSRFKAHLLLTLFLAGSSAVLNGCALLVVGGAAAGGYYVLAQERSAETTMNDLKTKTLIHDRLAEASTEYLKDTSVFVLDGTVLLTGVVPTPEDAATIKRLTSQVAGVATVYSELWTDGNYTAGDYADDNWIGTQLRARLIADKDVHTVNYDISIVRGHVYLFGIALSADEQNAAVQIARTTKGVRKVHNYLFIKPDND